MASSRIFVKGLPPTFTETEFKKHFSLREVTDAKIFPNRRIGYVGYRTPEDAQKAVKYYNKTFIRMSRIAVEIARPVQDRRNVEQDGSTPTARKASEADKKANNKNNLKRKRSQENEEQQDPKLKEFMEVMKPKSKKKAWENEQLEGVADDEKGIVNMAVDEQQSDGEYEEVPKKSKRLKPSHSKDVPQSHEPPPCVAAALDETHIEPAPVEPAAKFSEGEPTAVTDSDWARSRTSRLLGLLAEDEEVAVTKPSDEDTEVPSENEKELEKGSSKIQDSLAPGSSIPTPPLETEDNSVTKPAEHTDTDAVRSSRRLFVRNLPYDVRKEDLEAEFASYGSLEEVSLRFLSRRILFVMTILIGTADATAFDVKQGEHFSRCFSCLSCNSAPIIAGMVFKENRLTAFDRFTFH